MSKEEKRVPEVRFEGFHDDWKQRKLGECLTVLKDGTHGTHKNVKDGPFLLSAKNIKNGKINIDGNDRKISQEEFKKIHKNFQLKKGDVLLTVVGSIGEAAIIQDSEGITFQRSVAYLRSSEINTNFLYALVISLNFQKELKNRQVVSAQPGVYLGDLAKIKLKIPDEREEQKKIGTFLKRLDNAIALHQEKLNKLRILKEALLQGLFPKKGEIKPEVRFTNFTGPWQQRRFDKMWRRSAEKNRSMEYSPKDVISVAKMELNPSDRDPTDEYMKTYNILHYGDIAYEGNKSKKYTFGRFVLNDIQDGIVSHVFITFRPISPMDIGFMKFYINNEQTMKHHLVKATTKSLMMTTLNIKDINKQKLTIPSLDEQQKIGSLLKKITENLTLYQLKLKKLQSLKKAFLQKMFT